MASNTKSGKPSKSAVEQFCTVTGTDFRYCYIWCWMKQQELYRLLLLISCSVKQLMAL